LLAASYNCIVEIHKHYFFLVGSLDMHSGEPVKLLEFAHRGALGGSAWRWLGLTLLSFVLVAVLVGNCGYPFRWTGFSLLCTVWFPASAGFRCFLCLTVLLPLYLDWLWDLRVSLWVAARENLLGGLAKLCDLDFKSCSLHRVLEFVEVNAALVGDRVEHVTVLDAALLAAENQVDPEMEIFADIG